MPSELTRPRLLTLAAGFASLVLAHGALEAAALRAEARGASLWRGEEYLDVLTRSVWGDAADGTRLLACGPSEAREAFRTELLEERLPGVRARSGALSWGTLADHQAMLDHVERTFGPEALPEVVVVGLTPRFVSNRGLELSPLVRAIDRWSPCCAAAVAGSSVALAPKSALAGLVARASFRLRQGPRYAAGLLALARELARAALPDADLALLDERLEPYRFARREPRGEWLVRRFVEEPRGLWLDVQAWDPRAEEDRVRADVGRLARTCAERGIELFAVNLPVRPAARPFYDPALLAEYVEVVRAALGEVPLLDLQDLLADEEFFDSVHTTRAGAERTTEAVAAWLAPRLRGRLLEEGAQ